MFWQMYQGVKDLQSRDRGAGNVGSYKNLQVDDRRSEHVIKEEMQHVAFLIKTTAEWVLCCAVGRASSDRTQCHLRVLS